MACLYGKAKGTVITHGPFVSYYDIIRSFFVRVGLVGSGFFTGSILLHM